MQGVFSLIPGQLSIETIRFLMTSSTKLTLDESCWDKVYASQQTVQSILDEEKTVYGINTGFGLLANQVISKPELAMLQRNLLLSHAAGTGELLDNQIVKLVLLLKINSLARGFSGIRRELLDALIGFYNQGIYPCIPAKGSVGASGDLAPLAHLCLPLIGEGEVYYQEQILPAAEALKLTGMAPVILAPKEGLALINGTQVSTAIALHHLINAKALLKAAVFIGALSVDAAAGSDAPFHKKIHEVRGQQGQIIIASRLRELLQGSAIRDSHQGCTKVQDPYCLRCQPQVLGASLDNLNHAETILIREANAVSDNPLVFSELNTIISGGNFHAEPVAQIADLIAIAVAEIGALAERRIALLVDPQFNGNLPAFLIHNCGLNSGFMIAHVTAAALASANKSLAHPASVDSLPTSANQEDHVSMATYAAWRLGQIVENVQDILAIELLAAAQGINLRQPLTTSDRLSHAVGLLRKEVPFLDKDRLFANDIKKAKPVVYQLSELIKA